MSGKPIIRITTDLTLVTPSEKFPLQSAQAFRLARDLLKFGARRVVLDEADRSSVTAKTRRKR